MANKKPSPKKKGKRYNFQFTFTSLILSSIGLLIVLAWVFSLGIMVGRGFFPGNIGTFFSIKEKTVENKEKIKIDHSRPIEEEELTFYNQLVDKKDRAYKKTRAKPPPESEETTSKKTEIRQIRKDIRNHGVQVAALRDKIKTEKMVERLTGLGYPAYYYQTLINGKIYYRIRCGPFPTIEEAKKCAKRLVDKEGLKPFIVYPTKTE